MSMWYLLVAALAAVNAVRIRPGIPDNSGARIAVTGGGAVIAFAGAASAEWWAQPFLDALEITAETWRIAAGSIALVAGVWVLMFPIRKPESGLGGWGAMLAPIAFPLILTPELASFTLLFAVTEPANRWLPVLAVALLTVPVAAIWQVRRPGLWRGSSRLVAALLVAVAITQIIEGIRDV